jgi:hypothetical protein
VNPFEIDAAMLSAEAAKVQFFPLAWKVLCFAGRMLREALLGIPTAIGFVFGSLWFGLVMIVLAVYYGFQKGRHYQPKPPRQPSLPQ